VYTYYVEFVTDTAVLGATLAHYLHIILVHGISLTLIDVVLFLQMRNVWHNLTTKIAAYRYIPHSSRIHPAFIPHSSRIHPNPGTIGGCSKTCGIDSLM
jgi:autocrine motility factor receptor